MSKLGVKCEISLDVNIYLKLIFEDYINSICKKASGKLNVWVEFFNIWALYNGEYF